MRRFPLLFLLALAVAAVSAPGASAKTAPPLFAVIDPSLPIQPMLQAAAVLDAKSTVRVALAKSLDLSVTAEGIETPTQQAHLTRLGCERGQGYLFSKPVPNAECDELLRMDSAHYFPSANAVEQRLGRAA